MILSKYYYQPLILLLLKLKPYILLIALIACQTGNKKNNAIALGKENQKVFSAFENAQKSNDSISIVNILASSTKNSILLNSLIQKANLHNIICFLEQQGFINMQIKGSKYNYHSLCNFEHSNIVCLINRIGEIQIHNKELQSALKIAGCCLTDTMQRDNFIINKILVNKEIESDELNYISHLIMLNADNIAFQSAFSSIIHCADKKTMLLFLKKSGYLEFNSRADEYINYYPEKLAHLSTSIKKEIFNIAEIQYRE